MGSLTADSRILLEKSWYSRAGLFQHPGVKGEATGDSEMLQVPGRRPVPGTQLTGEGGHCWIAVSVSGAPVPAQLGWEPACDGECVS